MGKRLGTRLGTSLVVASSGGGGCGGAPTGLSYSTNPASYAQYSAITPNTPSVITGPVVSYSILPALPPGLTLNTTTGVITGTPTADTSMTAYTVTATNASGSTGAA